MAKGTLPKVVIVGRTNVGKSTLFNRISVDVKSIALDQEGVTRDIIKDTVCWQGKYFELVDTGGISLRKTQDHILEQARERALHEIKEASLILFVCDGTVGLLTEDREIARILHRQSAPVVLLVNKSDVQVAQDRFYEFAQLGFDNVAFISAQHSRGISDVLEAIVTHIKVQPSERKEQEPTCRVVILGKPNVGKSSLMNLLVKQERSIVADMPGTTREAIGEPIQFYKEVIHLTDTPGVRKKRSVEEPLEKLMVKSSFEALKAADIVLLMVDAVDGRLADQELKLLFYAFQEQHKAVIVLFNKQDAVGEYEKETMLSSVGEYKYLLKKLVTLDISCKTGKNIGRILPLVEKVWQRHTHVFLDDDLTFLFKEALEKKPLYKQTELLHVRSARQIKGSPITILVRVNEPRYFGTSQLAFLEGILRKAYDLQGVPVVLLPRKNYD